MATFGEWAVTAHKIQQVFCELEPRTRLITVRAMVCHESDPDFQRYRFQHIRDCMLTAIRATGQPVTVHEVATQANLQEHPIPQRQKDLDRARVAAEEEATREEAARAAAEEEATREAHPDTHAWVSGWATRTSSPSRLT